MKQYWLIQFIGWGLLFATDTLLKVSVGMVHYPLFFAVFILYTFGFAASHGLRYQYRRWQHRHLLSVIGGVFLMSLIGAAGAASLMICTLIVIGHPLIDQAVGALDILFINNMLVLWAVLVIWSGLYFFVTRQRKVDELEVTQRDLEHNLNQAQLNALLTQLNPHFMFNCINNIRALILEDATRARDMLANLAEMLRYNLQSDTGETTTLESELEIVTTYISLIKMQYEDRLVYEPSISSGVGTDTQVPRLMLQLLVENAIKHGIANAVNGGKVTLSIGWKAKWLRITVTNPGQLQPNQKGIGVDNIRRRLQLIYGDEHRFHLYEQDGVVMAEVLLPGKEKTCA
ncbi:sensor histidine kinase [Alteromonas antoniana]|uniref:sensor histidine kinase n=1 Tax=Alteromonas antoniana TaxID=2803813 RepID=UPI001C445E7C